MASLTPAELADLLREGAEVEWSFSVLDAGDGVRIIVEDAGGPPTPAAEALRSLAFATRGRARGIAVIGRLDAADGADDDPTEAHDRIGRLAVRLNIDRLVVIGEPARAMHLGAQHEGSWGSEAWFVDDEAGAYDAVRALLRPGDVVLVKSSRAADLRGLARRLASRAADPVAPDDAGADA